MIRIGLITLLAFIAVMQAMEAADRKVVAKSCNYTITVTKGD